MKKFYSFLFAAVALVGFAACNSDNTEEPAPEQVTKLEYMKFTANAATRTQLDEDGLSVNWTEGDKIAVGVGTEFFEFEATSIVGNKATFEGLAPKSHENKYYAIYPFSAAKSFKNGEWEYNFNNDQQATAKSFAEDVNISTAVSEGTHLTFENQLAVLKFQVPAACEMVEFFNGENSVVKVKGAMAIGKDYYAVVAPETYTFTVRIDGYLSKKSEKGLVLEKNTIYNLKTLPKLERFSWGLVGEHQGWDISNPSSMYKVDENVYAALNQTLKANGFKFAKVDGAASWNDNTTNFGAWTKSSGKEYFNFMTEMSAGSWYGNPLYSNNAANDQQNIGVTDFNTSYDIYLAVTASGNWGIGVKYTIVEAGTAVTYPF